MASFSLSVPEPLPAESLPVEYKPLTVPDINEAAQGKEYKLVQF
jgi:hypothetical protein